MIDRKPNRILKVKYEYNMWKTRIVQAKSMYINMERERKKEGGWEGGGD